MERLLSAKEVAAIYECPLGSLYYRVAIGKIPPPCVVIGAHKGWRIEIIESDRAKQEVAK